MILSKLQLLGKKKQFISVSKTVTAKKMCLGQVEMCTCFTQEIQFQIFSAVSLVISSNTFMLLNIFFSHLPASLPSS